MQEICVAGTYPRVKSGVPDTEQLTVHPLFKHALCLRLRLRLRLRHSDTSYWLKFKTHDEFIYWWSVQKRVYSQSFASRQKQ